MEVSRAPRAQRLTTNANDDVAIPQRLQRSRACLHARTEDSL